MVEVLLWPWQRSNWSQWYMLRCLKDAPAHDSKLQTQDDILCHFLKFEMWNLENGVKIKIM